jgi:hypothetical protein
MEAHCAATGAPAGVVVETETETGGVPRAAGPLVAGTGGRVFTADGVLRRRYRDEEEEAEMEEAEEDATRWVTFADAKRTCAQTLFVSSPAELSGVVRPCASVMGCVCVCVCV